MYFQLYIQIILHLVGESYLYCIICFRTNSSTAYHILCNNLQVVGMILLLINDILIIIDRSLKFIEDYINNEVLPLYANTHTETSQCSHQMTQFREEARYVTY